MYLYVGNHLILVMPLGSCILPTGRSLAKIVETTCDKKKRSNIFIVEKFCKEDTSNIGGF